MAKNITLMGADYPDVPAVQLPQTGGGTATFYDIQVVDSLNSTSTTDALSAKQGKVLNDNLKQLKDLKAWANYTKPTLSNGSHYGDGTYYAKFGCFVQILISVQFTSAPSNQLLFTLPAGYRPISTMEVPVSGGGSYNAKAQCVIYNTGEVKVTSVDKWVVGGGLIIASTMGQ